LLETVKYNNIEISKLALGTVQFGLEYGISNVNGKPSQKEVNEIIDFVKNKGLNCLDTAQSYGNSESVIGVSIENNNNFHIISKMNSDNFDLNLIDSINSSFKKLKKNSIFALLLHDSKLLYHWDSGQDEKVNFLKKQNMITYFGVSIYTNDDFELALKNESINLIQIPYNIFDQRALLFDWFKKAKKYNKLIFIRSIFLQGLLLMDSNEGEKKVFGAQKYIKELDFFCKEYNLSRSELALSFVYSTCDESIMLFGSETLKQVKENINNFENMNQLDKKIQNELIENFMHINESIFNPTKWEKK